MSTQFKQAVNDVNEFNEDVVKNTIKKEIKKHNTIENIEDCIFNDNEFKWKNKNKDK